MKNQKNLYLVFNSRNYYTPSQYEITTAINFTKIDPRVRRRPFTNRVPSAGRSPRIPLLPPWCQRTPLHYRVRDNVYGPATRSRPHTRSAEPDATRIHRSDISTRLHYTFCVRPPLLPVEQFLPFLIQSNDNRENGEYSVF